MPTLSYSRHLSLFASADFARRFTLAWFALCIFASLALTSQAQDAAQIGGRITDDRGDALAGASVTLYERERPQARRSTVTDETGAYSFERVAPGEYLIEAETAGFTRAAARSLRVESNANVNPLDISLEVAGVRADVVVTAAGTPQSVDETSKAITIVSRRELEERNEFSVADSLRTVPGLRVQQLGSFGRLTAIRTRGLRTQDTAVLIDGQRFRDAGAITGDASSFLSDLIVTNLDSIEVLRGSGSSLYGTNAIGGVVNLRTDEGGGRTRGETFAEGGNFGYFRGGARVAGGAGAGDRFAYSAGISHLNVARGVDMDDAARNTNAQGRAQFRITPTASVSARIYAGDSFVQLNSTPVPVPGTPANAIVRARALDASEVARLANGAPASTLNYGDATFIPDVNDPDASQATRFFAGALVFTGRAGSRVGYTISYQALTTDRTTRDAAAGVQNFTLGFFQPFGGFRNTDFDGRIQTVNARTDIDAGRFGLVTAGYEFENENYFNRTGVPSGLSTADVTERSHTFFVQDQLRYLEDRLQLSGAFRVQAFRDGRPRFTGTATAPYATLALVEPPTAYTGDGSIAYLFRSTDTKVRAHVGNGYRAPSLYQRFGTSGSTALGEPFLRPERSIAVDAGIDQTFARDRVRASATYFYTRLQEVIDFGAVRPLGSTPRPFGGYLNTGGGLARGVELGTTLAPTRTLDLAASYTFTNSDTRTPQALGVISSYVIPDHQFTFVATQRVTNRLLVNADFAASTSYLAPLGFPTRVFEFDGLLRLDVGASYTLPVDERRGFRFYGRVDNLIDRERYENGFRLPGATLRAGTAFRF